MSIYTPLRTALRNVALVANNSYPTMPVIHSHQNGAEPAESYISINILSIEQEGGHSTSTLTRVDETLDIRVAYEVLVQFSFFGSLSGNASHDFTQRIKNNPLVFEELAKNKLGIMRKSTLRRAPQKRDTQWIEAFNMDVTFSYFINTNELVGVVEGVVISDETGEIPVIIKIPDTIIYP